MEKMTRKEKLKKFANDHKDELALATVILGTTATIIATTTTVIGSSNTNRAHDNRPVVDNAWHLRFMSQTKDENKLGNAVYLLHDYSYIVIPEETPVKLVRKDEI